MGSSWPIVFDEVEKGVVMSAAKVRYAEGYIYFLESGGKLIDMISGSSRVSLGHNHPVMASAICSSAHLMSSGCYGHDPAEALRSEIVPLCDCYEQWHFTSSNDHAIDLAVMAALEARYRETGKVARKVLTIPGGFHGSTFGAGHFFHDFELYRRPYDIVEVPVEDLIADPIPAYLTDLDFDAFILEPVQRLSGFTIGYELLRKISMLCRSIGAYLIADETCTSLGRCGLTGFVSGVGHIADIVVVGSSLGQGLPIAGVGLHRDRFAVGFGVEAGWPDESPLICAVAAQVLKVIKQCHDTPDCVASLAYALGEAWRRGFPDLSPERLRVHGAMIHLNVGVTCEVVRRRLLEVEHIVVSACPPWLVMMPCFFMPNDITERVIKAVKEALECHSVQVPPTG